jgi:pyrroloquinoline-quinone synthase
MDRISQLDAIIGQFDLNGHPFYQEWRMGTLPLEKLRDYAGEYGQFVGTIASGWDTLGEAHYAEEERVHEKLWDDFKAAIGCEYVSNHHHTDTLVTAAKNLYSTRPEAIGALYAFEAQQPNTTQSKLDGLNEHYNVSEKGKEYFVVHASDFCEVELLKKYVTEMSDADFIRCKNACALLCSAMWGGLDGIYAVAA